MNVRGAFGVVLAAGLVVGVLAIYSFSTPSIRTVTVSTTVIYSSTRTYNSTLTVTDQPLAITNGSQPVLCSYTFYEYNDIGTTTVNSTTITIGNSTTVETTTITSGFGESIFSDTYVTTTHSTNSAGYVVSSTTIYSNNPIETPTAVETCTYLP
jgi:hypothetical protein